MVNLKNEHYLKIILLISFISIMSAYFIEYVLGHQPCNLCLIERIPYILSIVLIILSFKFKKSEKFIVLLLILTFIFSLLISVYHLGIEQGFFEESAVCNLKNTTDILSKEELLKILNEKTISCKDVTFRIFGLSLTSANILISIIIIVSLIKIYYSYEKIKSQS
ncbi:disulfide bond formation protein B [Candidatus Pelagibacter sp.]|nr:disulfide bond formation protein B [Candidatus Pelagibacter sp.]